MTNPAEKIRQVVKGHIEALDGIELYKGDKRTSMCLVSTAKQSTLYMAESILNAIIEEITALRKRSEKKAMYTQDEDQTIHAHAVGMTDATYEVLRLLEEARTSLTTIL